VWILLIAACAIAANPRELVEKAAAARDAGRLEESLELMRQAYALDPQPQLLNNTGALLEQLGRYDEACAAYEAVLAAPNVDPVLRALDRERLERLQPKLNKAHLRYRGPPGTELVLSDGTRIAPDEERAIASGRSWVAVYDPAARALYFSRHDLLDGRRTDLKESGPHAEDGFVELLPPGANELAVDGKRWRVSEGLDRARLAEGFYELEVVWHGSPPLVWRGSIARSGKTVIERKLTPAVTPPITELEEPKSGPLWPYAAFAIAAASGAAAIAFFASAQADVNKVQGDADDVTCFDPTCAHEWDDRAAKKNPWTVIFSITGAVAFIAGAGGLVF
jgi:hypothetical protein